MQPLIICEHCDTVYQRAELRPGQRARCLRCAAPLYRAGLQPSAALALTAAAAMVFLIANLFPIVTLEMQGSSSQSTLWGAIHAAWDGGVTPVAVLVALTAFFFPLLQIMLLGAVLLAFERGLGSRTLLIDALHSLRFLRPWSMVEVFLLGALVAVVKMGALAAVQAQPGLYGFGALTLLLAALNAFDLHPLWESLDEHR